MISLSQHSCMEFRRALVILCKHHLLQKMLKLNYDASVDGAKINVERMNLSLDSSGFCNYCM
jgi:hypothetical protein